MRTVPVPVPVLPPVGGGDVGGPPPPQATNVISTAVNMSCRISRSYHLAAYRILRVKLQFPSIKSKEGIESRGARCGVAGASTRGISLLTFSEAIVQLTT